MEGCGGLWRAVEGCGLLWRVVEGCGGLWIVMEGCGGLWIVMERCRGLWSAMGFLGLRYACVGEWVKGWLGGGVFWTSAIWRVYEIVDPQPAACWPLNCPVLSAQGVWPKTTRAICFDGLNTRPKQCEHYLPTRPLYTDSVS